MNKATTNVCAEAFHRLHFYLFSKCCIHKQTRSKPTRTGQWWEWFPLDEMVNCLPKCQSHLHCRQQNVKAWAASCLSPQDTSVSHFSFRCATSHCLLTHTRMWAICTCCIFSLNIFFFFFSLYIFLLIFFVYFKNWGVVLRIKSFKIIIATNHWL